MALLKEDDSDIKVLAKVSVVVRWQHTRLRMDEIGGEHPSEQVVWYVLV